MANPQPTDAHLRVAHSIYEAIMTRDFTKRQRKILDLILRLSWGCGKKDAYIPYQRDFSVVGVHEVDIKGELDWLAVSKVIAREDSFYWFNKDFEQWEVSRVKPYQPKKLSELLRLNLNGNRPELSKTLSENLAKHLVSTKQNAKFFTPNLASPKERGEEGGGVKVPPSSPHKEILKKEEIYIDINSLLKPKEAFETWKAVLKELQLQVSKSNYRTWLKGTEGLGYKGDCFVIGVPSGFVAEYLDKNQRSLIEKTLIGIIKRKVVMLPIPSNRLAEPPKNQHGPPQRKCGPKKSLP